ncbi:hypothetical protein PTKIN_Ptkin01aG0005100 [Pterospermum kingtungense]
MPTLIYIAFMSVIMASGVAVLGYSRNNSRLPYNWPLLGMLPALASHVHRIHHKFVEILETSGGTFQFLPKNSWFLDMDILLTSDPTNVQHIMSSNFSGYHKGVEWTKRFDNFGDSIFNFDFGKWRQHRPLFRGFLNHQRLQQLLPKIFEDSMEKQLIPFLDHVCRQDVPVALQHLVDKVIFYFACKIVTGCDPGSFQTSSDDILFSRAIGDACEAIAFRYILPESIWKLQKRLGIGQERRLSEAWMILDHLMSEYMSVKRKELRKEEMNFSFLELILIKDEALGPLSVASDKVIRDNLLGFMFAAHDAPSTALHWFFCLLSKHPEVERKIRGEMQQYLPENGETKWLAYGAKELNKMEYLHAALCETLRLHPPVPFQSRSPLQNETLPSGHKINERTRILICTFAMGRMKSIWGEDCLEFKPERWITDDGGIKHEAAHKFFAFNAGPRICPGKDIAFTLMKATASAIIHNYHIQVIENQEISPRPSIILHMSEDVMVKVKKKWA